jgi:hypothetical protein
MGLGYFVISAIVSTSVAGTCSAVLMVAFLWAVIEIASNKSEGYSLTGNWITSRSQISILIAMSLLLLTLVSAGQFVDTGFYQRFDGIDVNYARWIGIGVAMVLFTVCGAQVLGLRAFAAWHAVLWEGLSAFCFNMSLISTSSRRWLWWTFGAIFGVVSLLILVSTKNPARNNVRGWLYLVLHALVFGFPPVIEFVSSDLENWAHLANSTEMYAAAVCAISLFGIVVTILFKTLLEYEALPTDMVSSRLASSPQDHMYKPAGKVA